jgi:hypothetical protein
VLLQATALTLMALVSPGGQGVANASELALERVVIESPSADQAQIMLSASVAPAAVVSTLTAHRLLLGDAVIPLDQSPTLACDAKGCQARATVTLRNVPEAILELDPARVPVRWEGLAGKRVALVISGDVALADRNQVQFPVERMQTLYGKLVSYSLTPHGTTLAVKALLSLYNPFAFEVTVTSLKVKLAVGSYTVVDSTRPGFRLRPQKSGDVLVEEEVGLGEMAGALTAFLGGAPATLDGKVVIRTPRGERGIPLQASKGR